MAKGHSKQRGSSGSPTNKKHQQSPKTTGQAHGRQQKKARTEDLKEQDAIIVPTTENSQMTDNDRHANEEEHYLDGANIKNKKRSARKTASKTKMNQRTRNPKAKTTQDLSLPELTEKPAKQAKNDDKDEEQQTPFDEVETMQRPSTRNKTRRGKGTEDNNNQHNNKEKEEERKMEEDEEEKSDDSSDDEVEVVKKILRYPNECRYPLRISFPMTNEPWEHFVEQLKNFLKIVHEGFNPNVHILPWDPEDSARCPPIKNEDDFPKAERKSRGKFQMYFGGIFACPKAKEATAFLKLRVGIKDTDTMDNDIDQMGQILDDHIQDEMYISFSRNPYACQAVKVETLGSLFSSTRSMDSEILVRAIKKELEIPPKVELGATWRTLKNEKKQQYAWNSDYPPSQAIHLEIDANYAPKYYDAFSELFGTGSPVRILGTQMRLVPCPASPKGIGLSDNQMTNILIMHSKQQYFTNEHTICVENNHI